MVQPIWTPSAQRIAAANITRFQETTGHANGAALHAWSIDRPGEFWDAVWDLGVVGERGSVSFDAGDATMLGARFFPKARLNFAQNLLRETNDEVAIVATDETGRERQLSRADLHSLVAKIAWAMRSVGVQPGDRIAAWMANVPETVAVMLAAASIGAVFSSTSPDFGTAGVVDRFGQIEPVLLFVVDGYFYGGKTHDCLERLHEIIPRLPTVRQTIVVRNVGTDGNRVSLPADAISFDEWCARAPEDVQCEFTQLPFDHPVAILYSSGTTGPPKCIVHRSGGLLLKHLSEHQLHCDIKPGDRVLYFTTCGWMMWNWLVSALASDATIVLFDGSPFQPSPMVLFDVVQRHRVSLLGISAKFIDSLRNDLVGAAAQPNVRHDLSALRTICSTGSPLVDEGFEYVYDSIAAPTRDVQLASMSGGTDLCGCLVMGDPTLPVFRGEIQGPALGVAATIFADDGSLMPVGKTGELVCTSPFPSMPLGFWNDPDGAKYQAAYFDRFAGIWAHGDFAAETVHGGFVIYGRSDATLNPGGVRIGTAELYRQVEALDSVAEALAIGQPWQGDVRIVLFVRLNGLGYPGSVSDEVPEDVQREIRAKVRTNCSPRHVPAKIVRVDDLPRTRSGKLAELAVADVVAGRTVRNREALANPEALDQFRARRELQT